MERIFTKEQVAALDRAIAQKHANPAMEFITNAQQQVIDAIPAVQAIADVAPAVAINTDAAGAVAALVGADTKPADPVSLKGKIPKGGLSLEELIKARDHALANQ